MNRKNITIGAGSILLVALASGVCPGQEISLQSEDGKITIQRPELKTKVERRSSSRSSQSPQQPREITLTATGGFESTKEKARESAVRAAVDRLQDYLQQFGRTRRIPTTEMIQRMLIPEHEKVTEEPIISETGKTETMYRITVALHVEPKHVREIRSRDRSSEALWILAGLGGMAAVAALFFRIDTWTKGYLTSWLVLGTVGATALVGGLWWMAK